MARITVLVASSSQADDGVLGAGLGAAWQGWEKENKDLDGDKRRKYGPGNSGTGASSSFPSPGRISRSGSLEGRSGAPDLAQSLCHTRLIPDLGHIARIDHFQVCFWCILLLISLNTNLEGETREIASCVMPSASTVPDTFGMSSLKSLHFRKIR